MAHGQRSRPINEWLARVCSQVAESTPELLPTLLTYAGEALFGRRFIADDLGRLPPQAAVLEVGAGSLLLSCQLVAEGFQVTALDPIGSGFSHFSRLQAVIADLAEADGCLPQRLDSSAELLVERDRFDYAFSINVMEHVSDVGLTIEKVGSSLKLGGRYRFTCPNYFFPYEPHFDMVTLFSKRLTERVRYKRIIGERNLDDPRGLWQSLNWIDVAQISRAVRRKSELSVTFNRRFLVSALERILFDRQYAERRSPSVRRAIAALVRLRLHHVFGLVPAMLQPTIDCTVVRSDTASP
jgi:SAM-dependent methyltransferase